MKVKIRKLRVSDGKISWKWRNNPEIWSLTGRKWVGEVCEETEKEWINEVLKKETEFRFAICIGNDKQYVGNVQLTNIIKGIAEFHIFIGEKHFWGKGIGTEATKLMIEFGFRKLNLTEIFLLVKEENKAAIKAYSNSGFQIIEKNKEGFYKMVIKKNEYHN